MGDTDLKSVDLKASLLSDFGFAFNDSNFSDRILRIEIVAEGDDETANSGESNWTEDSSSVLTVKTLHICSAILAAKSPFFYKLFSNGMTELGQTHATLKVNNHEEAALMELLSFMYCNTLTCKTTPALLDVLRVADKFEVASCMIYCNHSLSNLPMTTESALLYLSLPSSILKADEVKHLIDATKEFVVDRYKDISEYQDEIMNLPLIGIAAILSSDELHATSEDEIYDFALKWIKANYQNSKEQKEIFSTRLGQYIRFPFMTCKKLREIITCDDFDHEFATKYLLDALVFKAEASYHQLIHVKEEPTSTNRRFIERSYKKHPVKTFVFEHPKQQCIVYLDLKREQCAKLSPSERFNTQDFDLGEQWFYLFAQRSLLSGSFGLYLCIKPNDFSAFDVEFEFATRSKPTEMYVSLHKENHTFKEGNSGIGYRDLFSMPWSSFMAEDCVYFINGVLHLRVELTVKR